MSFYINRFISYSSNRLNESVKSVPVNLFIEKKALDAFRCIFKRQFWRNTCKKLQILTLKLFMK